MAHFLRNKLDIPSIPVDELGLSWHKALRTIGGVKFTDVKLTSSLIRLGRSGR